MAKVVWYNLALPAKESHHSLVGESWHYGIERVPRYCKLCVRSPSLIPSLPGHGWVTHTLMIALMKMRQGDLCVMDDS